ncbi:MAG TPA: hypothetical protein VFZ44_13105 [Pyrinomonadaceae bacterium]
MKRLFVALACLAVCAGTAFGQKGKAGADFYPLGYPGDVWKGVVTAFDNERRTLTLTHGKDKKAVNFVASIPDAPYEWTQNINRGRVLDFPYDKKATVQVFRYDGLGHAASIIPEQSVGVQPANGMQRRPNPPDENRITDFADFMGREIVVYYTVRERQVNGATEKYNDVWRVLILGKKK